MTHICVGNITIVGSDIGLPPERRQAIIWTNAGILFMGLLGIYFYEILVKILTFLFKKMRLRVFSVIWRSFCLGLNVSKVTASQRWLLLHQFLAICDWKWNQNNYLAPGVYDLSIISVLLAISLVILVAAVGMVISLKVFLVNKNFRYLAHSFLIKSHHSVCVKVGLTYNDFAARSRYLRQG